MVSITKDRTSIIRFITFPLLFHFFNYRRGELLNRNRSKGHPVDSNRSDLNLRGLRQPILRRGQSSCARIRRPCLAVYASSDHDDGSAGVKYFFNGSRTFSEPVTNSLYLRLPSRGENAFSVHPDTTLKSTNGHGKGHRVKCRLVERQSIVIATIKERCRGSVHLTELHRIWKGLHWDVEDNEGITCRPKSRIQQECGIESRWGVVVHGAIAHHLRVVHDTIHRICASIPFPRAIRPDLKITRSKRRAVPRNIQLDGGLWRRHRVTMFSAGRQDERNQNETYPFHDYSTLVEFGLSLPKLQP